MAGRLDWEKARRRDRQRLEGFRVRSAKLKQKRRLRDSERQQQLQRFAEKYGINCFGKVGAKCAPLSESETLCIRLGRL